MFDMKSVDKSCSISSVLPQTSDDKLQSIHHDLAVDEEITVLENNGTEQENPNALSNMRNNKQLQNLNNDDVVDDDDDDDLSRKSWSIDSVNKNPDSFADNSDNMNENTALTTSGENENSFKCYNSFEKDKQHNLSSVQNDDSSISEAERKFKRLAAFATLTSWWKKNVDIKISKRQKSKEKIEERKMRVKLQYHFLSPFEKYKMGRKPWKLGIQILKIILVTTQVILFGDDRFASVAFLQHTQKSFNYIFIPNFDGSSSFSLYSREQLVNTIMNVNEKYLQLTNISIGKYWHVANPPPPLKFCKEKIPQNSSLTGKDTTLVCKNVSMETNYTRLLTQQNYFNRIQSIQLMFQLEAVYLNGLILHHGLECLQLNVKVNLDNTKHDGRMRVSLKIDQEIVKCMDKLYKRKMDAGNIRKILIAFDALVVTICSVSVFLCLRSLFKSILLAKAAKQYFQEYRDEQLTKWDLVELINKWFPVIMLTDLLSIIGSIYKIRVDIRDIQYYNLSSLFLGVGVILVWVGFLRFFMFCKEYNTLLITLRTAAPSLLRFMSCAMFMFFGFTLCGWIVLGPYHEKFKTFLRTAECLYSLVNGDDMYPTFSAMPSRNVPIWIFSKIYLYVFVSLFIYLVLSTFISIVGDAYERLKDYGRMPPTRIERFIFDMKEPPPPRRQRGSCLRCEREATGSFLRSTSEDDGVLFKPGLLNRRNLSDSQISIVSASLD